ncbi:transposase family protein [[Kitasatospora] papulosa]|uniref:HARBI1 family protein n=1 Tax=[Kitasatospora] papulosa TaxID=1464011 RepID=UPI00367EC777
MKRSTAEHLARLLRDHRIVVRTRKERRALGCFRQAVFVLCWFIDGTRLAQLARDNSLSVSTAYRYLHQGLAVLAAGAPDLETALERAKAAGLTHLNLDGTVIRTDRVAAPGPNRADLWWSGKHKHHGGNVQVIATPDGWPIWVSPVRPGRDHDTTCARHHGLIDALNRIAAELNMPTLVDLGYENAGDGFRHPHKKPAAGELTEAQQTCNKVIRGTHGICERANSQRKTTSKALRRVSLDPSRITKIAAAAGP